MSADGPLLMGGRCLIMTDGIVQMMVGGIGVQERLENITCFKPTTIIGYTKLTGFVTEKNVTARYLLGKPWPALPNDGMLPLTLHIRTHGLAYESTTEASLP
jgi:hypothetical protein